MESRAGRPTLRKNWEYNMTNFEIIKEIHKMAQEESHLPEWERDGTEQLEKIQKLIEHRRPLNFSNKRYELKGKKKKCRR